MIDDLNAALYNEELPLAARLDAARQIHRILDDAAKAVRDVTTDLVQSTELDQDLLATLYWDYDDIVPSKLLGQWCHIRKVIEPRCPWTYPCPSCGIDEPVRSRQHLRDLRSGRGARSCETCIRNQRESSETAWREQRAAHDQRLRELRTMPYAEYLQTPEWQERRKARLSAARYRCQVCNTNKVRLNVHHRTYERRGNEFARDLIVLCETCHHTFHRNGSLAKD